MKWPKIYKPYLRLLIDTGWFHIRTDLMMKPYEQDLFRYIVVSWNLFKWKGVFDLYKPGYDCYRKKAN